MILLLTKLRSKFSDASSVNPRRSVGMKKEIITQTQYKIPFSVLIEKKIQAEELLDDEVRMLTSAIIDDEIPLWQLSAFLMAVYFQGMSVQESAVWTEELMLSGDLVDIGNISWPKIDRCTTGGVGDKSAFVLSCIAATCGIAVPALADRDDGFIISDIEKISSIPGFSTKFDPKVFKSQLRKVGCCYYEQPETVAPVDAKLTKLRRETGTIPSSPLLASSMLCRKLSSGIEGLVVDVKWGNGSCIKDVEQAKQLGRMITRVARSLNRKCIALVTDANQPLGKTVGTALEIKEVIELLKGEGDLELQDLILRMGMEIVRLAGVAGSTLSAKQMIVKKLSSGEALEKFKELIEAQGGDASCIEHPEKLPEAKHVRKLSAQKRGYIHTVNAGMIARGVRILAELDDGTIDYSVGVSDIMKVGMQIKQGEPLMMIHYNDESRLEKALEYFRDAYRLAPKRPVQSELVNERIA